MRCAAACPPQWTEFIDKNSLGGVLYDQHRTLASCQEFCAGLLMCVAIDYNTLKDQCWLHLDETNLEEQNDHDGVDQYVIRRDLCITNTTSTTSPKTTPTTLTTATTITTTGSTLEGKPTA